MVTNIGFVAKLYNWKNQNWKRSEYLLPGLRKAEAMNLTKGQKLSSAFPLGGGDQTLNK